MNPDMVPTVLLGGFVIFYYGITRLSEGLQQLAGGRLRALLAAFIKNRLLGGLIGVGVSTFTQSSTATAVIVVGIVNAGLIAMADGIPVLLGANIGASLTLQVLTLNPVWLLYPLLVLSALLRLPGREKRVFRDSSEVLFGLALLMAGLSLMTAACELLRDSEAFRDLIALAVSRAWLCLLLGAALTAVAQSVTAVMGMVIALAASGLIPFAPAVMLMLGANIGACAGTWLAARNTTLAARRIAAAQLLLNGSGALLLWLGFPYFLKLVMFFMSGDPDFVIQTAAQAERFGVAAGSKPYIARHLANANTLYALVCAGLFLPLTRLVARITARLVQGRDSLHSFGVKYIDDRVLSTPPVALGQARLELQRMAHLAVESLAETLHYLYHNSPDRLPSLSRREQMLDLLHRELSDFLVELSHRTGSAEMSREIARMMHMVSDLERIGDHCQTLVRLTRRKREWHVVFSPVAERELRDISDKTAMFLSTVVDALVAGDAGIEEMAAVQENEIDRCEETFRNRHIARLNTGECAVRPGLIYIDMLQALEKISDHTFSVARNVGGESA